MFVFLTWRDRGEKWEMREEKMGNGWLGEGRRRCGNTRAVLRGVC
jgi:hypothetical protein